MSKKSKKTGSKGKPAAPAANVVSPPAHEALAVHAEYDREKEKWFFSIREGKVEHHAHADGFASDDKAKAAGEKWLAKYAKASAGGRRKMLGWKADGAAQGAPGAKADEAATNTSATPERPAGERRAKGAKKEPKAKRVSGLDAAAQVLKDAGKPMGCSDIVETMLGKDMWKTGGKTPAATIYAAIIREISVKKNESRFKKTDRGLFEYHTPASGGR